jgi:hypothetical protein
VGSKGFTDLLVAALGTKHQLRLSFLSHQFLLSFTANHQTLYLATLVAFPRDDDDDDLSSTN